MSNRRPMAKIQTRDPKKVEALLKLRQSMQASQDIKDAGASALSRPTLNSTIALKNKALNQSRSVPRVPEEEVEREVRRMEEAGQHQVEMGVVDTLEASMVIEEGRCLNATSRNESIYHDLPTLDATVVLKPRMGKQIDPRWAQELKCKPVMDDPLLCPPGLYDYHIRPQPVLYPSPLSARRPPSHFAGPTNTHYVLDRELSLGRMVPMPASTKQELILDSRSWQAVPSAAS